MKYLGSENEGDLKAGEEYLYQVLADIEASEEWSFLRQTKSVSLASGQQEYTISGDFSISNYSKGMKIKANNVAATYKKILFLKGDSGLEQFNDFDDGQTGWPCAFVIVNGTVKFYPIPTTGKVPTCTLTWCKTIPEWSSREDDLFATTGIPYRNRETIVAGIVTKGALGKDDTNLEKFKVIYETGLEKMRKENKEA